MGPDVVVLGQLARDLVLVVDQVPGPGESGSVRLRREMLGGKGANQAVALAQLGLWPALVAVAGDDDTAPELLAQAKVDGIDVSAVVRRRGTSTGLIVDVVDPAGKWRYLEDLPPYVLLTETDVAAAASLIATANPGPVADTTGAGDAFTAALIAGLARGYDQERTARLAVAAAGATVAHPGGRPSLTEPDLDRQLALMSERC